MSGRPGDGASWSRRRWLQALGLSTSFLPSLARAGFASPAKAPDSDELRRLLVLFATQGTYWPNWHMNPENSDLERAWQSSLVDLDRAQFSPCLEPLYAHRRHLMALDGIGLGLTASYGSDAHHTGHAVALSGARPILEGKFATGSTGPSLDQIVAERRGGTTPLASLQYGQNFRPVSFDGAGRPLPSATDPAAAFARLFPGHGDGASLPASARGSVLDFVAGRSQRWRHLLSASDRQKLEHHHDLLRDLERQLQVLDGFECEGVTPPTSPPDDPTAWIRWHGETWIDLALLALRCGLSDVATVCDPGPDCGFLGLPVCDIHSEHAHTVGLLPESNAAMTEFYRYYARLLARMIAGLADVPEGEGSMLDHSLVVMSNELGSPNHDWAQYPMLLAGGAAKFSRQGTYFYWPATHELDGPFGPDTMGPAHNRVLVTIAQAFGVSTDSVGETSLTTLDGSELDLRFALPELS